MCGIAGVVSLGSPLEETDLRTGGRMTDMLRHRGPDDRGELHDRHLYMGNTRLSIIDLSENAHIPMRSGDGSVWLAYNGEITNFRDLEREFSLRERYRFVSTSDTETLLHLYEDMGMECLAHLSGMFAFCLYDRRRGKAYIVRDFYGTRPLFWMVRGDRLYFASEIKAFMQVPDLSPRVDREAIFHYFTLAYVPHTMTPLEGVHELYGGSLIEIDLSGDRPEYALRDYHTTRFSPDDSMTEEEADELFYRAILDSVDRNLISDAPVGLTLSGGLDSSSVLGLARKLGRSSELHTFSLRINESSFDESYYQRVMAEYAGSIHHEIPVNPEDVHDNIIRYMAYMDEPIGDGSAIPFYLLARQARKHVKVLLSGEGGDEISNAYETHMAFHVARMYRKVVPGRARRMLYALARTLPVSYDKLSFDFLARRFTKGASLPPPEAHMYYRHVLTRREKLGLMPGCGDIGPTTRFFRELWDSLDYEDGLDRLAQIDMTHFFIGDLMMKNDRMMMANSVEARFPFMDRIAVEAFSSIPARYKIRHLTRRYIEKKSMRRVLPPEVRKRQNFGIELPYSHWFASELRDLGATYFSRDVLGRSGLLDPDYVRTLWSEHMGLRRDHGRTLWCILNFLIWFDLFVYRGDFADYLAEA